MEERVSRSQLIRLGAALSVTVGGASILAACGGSETGGGSGGGASSSASGSTSGMQDSGQAIAAASDVAAGSALAFKDGGSDAVLVHLDSGDFVAYSAICTHQSCTVAYQDGQLACPCHGSIFDPANGGAVVNPPAQQPLPEIPVEVRDGQVYKA